MRRHVQVSRPTQLSAKAIHLLLAAALFAGLAWTALPAPVARAAAITVTVTSDDNTVNGILLANSWPWASDIRDMRQ